ncbi:50S ribosomal protein L29 [Anaerolineales bacterium]|jgi:large subunit ribosomal protein L29
MEISEIRVLADDKILDMLEDKKEEMYTIRLNASTGELKDTSLFKKVRSDVARLKTVLRERELTAHNK